jgi:hypothetical protein
LGRRSRADLRERLALAAGGDMGELLSRADVTVERLVNAFFESVRPYADMMSDLLGMFEQAGIATTDETAAIAFDFEQRSRRLQFDLASFRQAREVWRRAVADVMTRLWSTGQLWNLRRAVALDASEGHDPPAQLAAWLAAYDSGVWPEALPDPPRSGRPDVDERLRRAWDVWSWAVRGSAAFGPTRGDLLARWRAQRSEPSGAEENDAEDVEVLGFAESDHWAGAMARSAGASSEQIRTAPAGDSELLGARLIRQVDEAVAQVPSEMTRTAELVRDLEDVLALPFWKQRHELYSAWILTQIVHAVRPLRPVLHHEDGVLHFRFKAAKMVSLPDCDPPLAVWAELKTPLTDPVGKSRQRAIQPDYSIVRDGPDPSPPPDRSLLEIECKQYKTPGYGNFAAALADYARGRPNAQVAVVNHGRASAAALLDRKEVRPIADRAHVIGALHPRSANALQRFHLLVRGVVWPYRADPKLSVEPQLPPRTGGPAGSIRLARAREAHDLDLHLKIRRDGLAPQAVYRLARGRLDGHPFAHLADEVIVIERWLPAVYEIAVHAHSGEAPLAGCGAQLHVSRGDEVLSLTCPRNGWGRWWHVMTIDVVAGTTTIHDRLTDEFEPGPPELLF